MKILVGVSDYPREKFYIFEDPATGFEYIIVDVSPKSAIDNNPDLRYIRPMKKFERVGEVYR